MSMSVLAGRITDTLTRVRDRLAGRGDTVTGIGLWLLIAALLIWFALAETQLFVIGVIVGSVLALGAIGLTLIYGILRFANFAHGDTMMLGAYLAYLLLTGTMVGGRANVDVDVGASLDRLPNATQELGDLSF